MENNGDFDAMLKKAICKDSHPIFRTIMTSGQIRRIYAIKMICKGVVYGLNVIMGTISLKLAFRSYKFGLYYFTLYLTTSIISGWAKNL